MRTAAVKPVFHSLLTTYWHLPVTAALLLELLATLELFELDAELITELLTADDLELEAELGALLATLLELLVFALDATLLTTLDATLLDEAAPTMP